MGQHLSTINSKIVDAVKTSDAELNSGTITTSNGKEDINLFLTVKASISSSTGSSLQSDDDRQVPRSERCSIKQIQNNLSLLTDTIKLTDLNMQIHELFVNDIFLFVVAHHNSAIEELKVIFTNEQQLRESLTKKLADDQTTDRVIFPQRFTLSFKVANAEVSGNRNSKEGQVQELSYFVIQSLTSMLLSLIKSTEKNDPAIIHQVLTLASQLCEQIPVKCLSTNDNLLSTSLKPLTDYVYDLTLSKDSLVAKQALKVQLRFSIAQASFKDILPLLTYLIFITDDVFDVRSLFVQLNNDLIVVLDDYEKQKQQSTHLTETDEDDAQPAPESDSESKCDHDGEQEKDKDTTSYQTAG